MDQDEEDSRRKKERAADAAATAFAKVEPSSMLTLPKDTAAAKPEAKSGEVV
jgi:hypothetical protein